LDASSRLLTVDRRKQGVVDPKSFCFTAGNKELGGFNGDFRFTGLKHICPAFKDERRTDSNTENPTIKGKTLMKNQKIMFTSILLALACFTASPTALARPAPTPTPTPTATPSLGEDRGNGNSAAENVDALNLSATGSNNTAHG
jgi:hypothetical protein